MSVYRRVLISLVLAASVIGPASAQTHEEALFKAGYSLLGAISREGLSAGKSVGIAKFRDRIGASCEPMASVLTARMRTALIDHVKEMGFDTRVVESVDPELVDAVISGQWTNVGDGKVMLTVKLGDVKDLEFRDIGMAEASFHKDSLSPEAQRCVMTFEAVEREIPIARSISVRASPSSVGKLIDRLAGGTRIWVSARVVSKGGEGWFVVRLPDDDEMPVGMRERRGFVFDLRHSSLVKVTAFAGIFAADKMVLLHALPYPEEKQVAKVGARILLHVTGRVGKDWYRVDWKDQEAYVHAPALKAVNEREIAAWEQSKGCDDRVLRRFLQEWPDGFYAADARRLLETCKPPLEVKVWTGKKSYRMSEFVKVFLKGNSAFYARVIYRDVQGNLVQIYPNTYRKAERFDANRTYVIPSDDDDFDLEVGPPFGNESIMVFASTKPLPEMAGDDIGRGLTLLQDNVEGVQRKMRGITAIPKEEGGASEREFYEAASNLTTQP